MTAQSLAINAASDAWRAVFGMNDLVRRAQGCAFGAFGLGPGEASYQVVASGPFWRLRDYSTHDSGQTLLIIAAPIKRPYIWDLAAAASAIRWILRQGLHVYLLEWLPASQRTGENGLTEYCRVISECVAKLSSKNANSKPFLIGHSLGGTLAAIYAAWTPEPVRGLVLLGSPLCFEPASSHFRDALVALVPPDLIDAKPWPGSLLSHMSALASPDTFIWSRLADAALSISDRQALETHMRVERWALDEVPLPGKLVHEIIDWLYREDCFCRGDLTIDDKSVGPHTLVTPTLAVVNTADDVAPLQSVKPFLDAMPARSTCIVEYPGEIGVCLQHLGILVGRKAYSQVWPEIFSWISSQTNATPASTISVAFDASRRQ